MKRTLNPDTVISPLPVVMVTVGDEKEHNILAIAWTGIISSEPPMTYISVSKERYSHNLLMRTGEFIINLVPGNLTRELDYCGNTSGSRTNKFRDLKLTPAKGSIVSCPAIDESPINIECIVKEIKEFDSHDMFIAEIVSVTADEEYIDDNRNIDITGLPLAAFCNGQYFSTNENQLGFYGFSLTPSDS